MAVKAIADLQKKEAPVAATVGEPNKEPDGEVTKVENGHLLEAPFAMLREALDEALATPIDRESRLKMVQPALNNLADAIIARVGEESPGANAPAATGVTQDQLNQAVAAAVAPYLAELKALREKTEAKPRIPSPRAARFVAEGARASFEGPVPGATARIADEIADASALKGRDWRKPGAINPFNEAGPGTHTPKLSALIRRSVGIRE